MIKGIHGMFYSSEPVALREFLRDKMGLPAKDVGEGWLINDFAEADMGVHPTDFPGSPPSGTHAVSFYCDDIEKTVAEMRERGVEFLGGRIFSGWLGAYRNVAEDTSSAVYTGGVGLRFGRFEMGLSIAVAPGQVQVQSGDDEEKYPNAAAAALTISWQPRRNPA